MSPPRSSPLSVSSAPLRLVLFDVDGTLADSHAFIAGAARGSFEAEGALSVFEKVEPFLIGMTLKGFLAEAGRFVDMGTLKRIEDRFRHQLISGREQARVTGHVVEPLFPGIKAVLQTLDEGGYLQGIVTNKGQGGLSSVLANSRIGHHFVTLHHSGNSPSKPAPDMVLNALSATGVDPAHCVVVGDTMNDVRLARNAGVRVIGARWSPTHQVEADTVDAVADRVEDLVPVLQALLP